MSFSGKHNQGSFPFEVTVALLPGSEIMSLSRMTLERALFFSFFLLFFF